MVMGGEATPTDMWGERWSVLEGVWVLKSLERSEGLKKSE